MNLKSFKISGHDPKIHLSYKENLMIIHTSRLSKKNQQDKTWFEKFKTEIREIVRKDMEPKNDEVFRFILLYKVEVFACVAD